MDKLDMFQSRFGRIDKFGWWDLETISADAGSQFTSTELKQECQTRGVDIRSSGTSENEWTGQIYIQNIAYNYTLSYGTC